MEDKRILSFSIMRILYVKAHCPFYKQKKLLISKTIANFDNKLLSCDTHNVQEVISKKNNVQEDDKRNGPRLTRNQITKFDS